MTKINYDLQAICKWRNQRIPKNLVYFVINKIKMTSLKEYYENAKYELELSDEEPLQTIVESNVS